MGHPSVNGETFNVHVHVVGGGTGDGFDVLDVLASLRTSHGAAALAQAYTEKKLS